MKKLLLLLALAIPAFAEHSVTLTWSWTQSNGPVAEGFKVYRGTTASGPWTNIASVPLIQKTYVDNSTPVQTSGSTWYYYVTTTNTTLMLESVPSLVVGATIPFDLAAPTSLSFSVK